MKRFLKKIQSIEDKNIFIILISLIIFLSPLSVNYSDLPKGFELAKVNFLNLTTLLLFSLFLFQIIRRGLNLEQLRKNKLVISFIFLVFLSFFLSTILTSYPDIALFGNSFRQQGFFFHFLLIIIAVLSYLNINRKNYIFILLSIFFSAIIQSFVAIGQFIDFLNRRPELIDDGLYINGTFGQANFFSTLIVIGIASSILIFKLLLAKRFKFRRISLFLVFISFIIQLVGLTISYSIFGWIVGGLTLIVLLPNIFMSKSTYKKYFYTILLLLIPLSLILLDQYRTNLRYEIWISSIDIFLNNLDLEHQLFGSGFDTLGNVIRDSGKFPSAIIDRGHNILIDILMQIGIFGVIIVTFILFRIFRNLNSILSESYRFSMFIIFFLFFLKIIVHEYSAMQTFLLFILIGINLKAVKD